MKKILFLTAGLLFAGCSKHPDTFVDTSFTKPATSVPVYREPAKEPAIVGTPASGDSPKTAPGKQIPAYDTEIRIDTSQYRNLTPSQVH